VVRVGSFTGEWESPPSSAVPNPFGASLRLLVLGQTKIRTYPLPTAGEVTIGSALTCQVVIQEPGIAPLHAVLRLGPAMSLRDSGSDAGTMVGSQRLSPGAESPLAPGVVLQLAGVALVIQASGGSARLRHVRSHDYFEGRLEDECARAEAQGQPFAVVRIRFSRGQARAVEDAFSGLLRSVDLVAMYAADEYELLLTDAAPQLANTVCDRLRQHVAGAGLGELQIGLGCWPRQGRSPEALLAAAGVAIHGGVEAEASLLPTAGAIDALRPLLERVAPTQINVLILGETGVGKEVLARLIHELSPRGSRPMSCLNCAAFSENLLESELFGHERGAFTGAVQAKPGLLEAAQGGTVLLDEIGELPLALQAKLLRVVEHRQVTRLGGLAPRSIDVRFLAATNRDLEAEVARGAFRSDLYFRLNGVALVLPPLRERAGEIVQLALAFVEQFARQSNRPRVPRISQAALGVLERYTWPGNVRELRNVIERALMLCPSDVIDLEHLPLEKLGRTLPLARALEPPPLVVHPAHRITPTMPSLPSAPPRPSSLPSPGAYSLSSLDGPHAVQSSSPRALTPEELVERDRIARVLEACVGNQTHAAQELGLTRRALITRIERYCLPRPRKRARDA